MSWLVKDLKNAADKVEKWGQTVVTDGENTFKWGVHQGENVITHTEDTFSGIISTPLLLIAGGIAFFLYNSNAGQVAEATRNIGPVAAGL